MNLYRTYFEKNFRDLFFLIFPTTLSLASLVISSCQFIEAPSVTDSKLKSATYAHTSQITSCSQCHEGKRPKPNTSGIQHGSSSASDPQRDCVVCHFSAESWNSLASYKHLAPFSNCNTCHEASRPPKATNQSSHFEQQDCSNCHQPKQKGQGGFSFDHHDSNNRVIASCLPCHEINRKSSTHFSGQDCVSCHLEIGKKWIYANPHLTNTPLISCLSCHEKNRPDFAVTTSPGVGTAFSHTSDGPGECYPCHAQSTEQWKGAAFGHKPMPTTCNQCHQRAKPVSPVISFSHVSSVECNLCHSANPTNASSNKASWKTISYSHPVNLSGCTDCHEPRRPLPDHFAGHDCIECHVQAGISWKSNSPHPENVNLLNCNTCHEINRPALNGHYIVDR